MYKRILAIGDIHGEYDKLVDLYAKIDFNPPDDLLVFLGDYMDRGPKPVHVLGWMLKNRNNPHIMMLRGNHDQMMLDHYERKERERLLAEGKLLANCLDDLAAAPNQSGDYRDDWLCNGGGVTKKELKRFAARLAEKRGIPERRTMAAILRFIGGLPLFHRVEVGGRTYFFCHAGIDPDKPLDLQDPDDLLWIREAFIFHYTGSPMVVSGHTVVGGIRSLLGMEAKLWPIIQDNMILADTGACYSGPLSCVDVLNGRVWQSG